MGNVYRYSWNQAMDHEQDEIAACWFRLDGQVLTKKDDKIVQDRFMIQIPDSKQSIVLNPKEFKDNLSSI